MLCKGSDGQKFVDAVAGFFRDQLQFLCDETEEVKACCADLRLLNKSDFKMLLKWRLEMLKTHKEEIKQMRAEGHEGHEGHEVEEKEEKEEEEKEKKEEEEEKEVSTEQQLQEVREKVAVGDCGGCEA